ncbi:MAG: hypothetical protein ABW025_13590, partial [Cellulomonas sp.]
SNLRAFAVLWRTCAALETCPSCRDARAAIARQRRLGTLIVMNTPHATPRPYLTTLTLPIEEVRDGDTVLALESPDSARLRRQRTNARGLPGWRISRTVGRGRVLERIVYCSFADVARETAKWAVPQPAPGFAEHRLREFAENRLRELAALTIRDIEALARAMDRTWPLPPWADDLYGPNGEGRGDLVRLMSWTGLGWPAAVRTPPAVLRYQYRGSSRALLQVIDRLDEVRARGRERDGDAGSDSWRAAVCGPTGAPESRARISQAFEAALQASGTAVMLLALRLRYPAAQRSSKTSQHD